MRVIVVNSGSSSIKYELFERDGLQPMAKGLLERIGSSDSRLKHSWFNPSSDKWEVIVETRAIMDHRQGFSFILDVNSRAKTGKEAPKVFGVGHRVVHGGEKFSKPALIDDATIKAIEELTELAPLHNPANIIGIKVMRDLLPHIPQLAVFDTAFHQTMPKRAFHYALPAEFYNMYSVRRYGFHGSSHGYVAKEAARHLGVSLEKLNLITLHLGNGTSAAAIEGGKCIDTSMGMTPLAGLVMGTRCGDLDPAVPFYLQRRLNKPFGKIEDILNRESGLKGICGRNDMREILDCIEDGDAQAKLAFEIFCYRIKKYIGAYFAVLGSVDAVVFTGGIGENSALVRAGSCNGLTSLGISLDEIRNSETAGEISRINAQQSKVKILVIPTNEELEIAQQTVEIIEKIQKEGRI